MQETRKNSHGNHVCANSWPFVLTCARGLLAPADEPPVVVFHTEETSKPEQLPHDANAGAGANKQEENKTAAAGKGKGKAALPMVSIRELYRFASPLDRLLLFLGTLMSIAAGGTMPAMSAVLGRTIGSLAGVNGSIREAVTKDVYWLLIIGKFRVIAAFPEELGAGGASFVACYLSIVCYTIVAENQVKRIREEYFKAVVRQELGWFDAQRAGDLSSRLSA